MKFSKRVIRRLKREWERIIIFLKKIRALLLRDNAKEFALYAKACRFPIHLPRIKFIIVTMGRTGSDLLVSLLRCHPDIDIGLGKNSELLMNPVVFPERYIWANASLAKNRAFGFKLKRYLHLVVNQKIGNPDNCLRNWHKEGWKIIHLYRENLLRLQLSILLAQHLNKYHRLAETPLGPISKIKVDCNLLFRNLQGLEYQAKEEIFALKSLSPLPLKYEDDLINETMHQSAANKVFSFLGLPPVSVKTNYVRTTPQEFEVFIENHDEVLEALTKSEFAHYLDA